MPPPSPAGEPATIRKSPFTAGGQPHPGCGSGAVRRWPESAGASSLPALRAAGAPDGVCNVVCGGAKEAVDAWLEDPLVDDIAFVGSSEVGIPLGQECFRYGKKPLLELAGNDGFVVWDDADLDRAAQAAAECFMASTKICMVPKYAVVHPAVAPEFLRRLTALARRLRPSLPSAPDAVLAPVGKAAEFVRAVGAVRAAGAEVLTGGSLIGLDGAPAEHGPFAEPAVVRVDGLEAARALPAVTEETFFPLLPVVVPTPHEDGPGLLARVAALLNANAYGLRNSLWTGSDAVVEEFLAAVTNGGLIKVNDSHAGAAPYAPTHGGTGLSGGPHGESYFPLLRATHLQAVSIGTGVDATRALTEVDASGGVGGGGA